MRVCSIVAREAKNLKCTCSIDRMRMLYSTYLLDWSFNTGDFLISESFGQRPGACVYTACHTTHGIRLRVKHYVNHLFLRTFWQYQSTNLPCKSRCRTTGHWDCLHPSRGHPHTEESDRPRRLPCTRHPC